MEDSNPSQINFQESDFSHLNNEDMIFQRYTYTDHHNDQFFFFSAQDEADSKDNNSDSSHENEPDQIADSEQHSEPSIQLLSRNIPRESKKKSSFRTSKISSTIFLGSSKTKSNELDNWSNRKLKSGQITSKNQETRSSEGKIREKSMKQYAALYKRKTFRIVTMVTLTFILLLSVFLTIYKGLLFEGVYSIPINADLDFTLTACSLFILDLNENDEGPISLSYRLTRKAGIGYSSYAGMIKKDNLFNFTFFNEFEAVPCQIKLKKDIFSNINSMRIKCNGNCQVIQDSALLNITTQLILEGEEIHSNFKEISCSEFYFNSNFGYLQLNSIQLTSSKPAQITMGKKGDIIVQSTQDFQISAFTNSQAFCFGAPFTLMQPNTSGCSISGLNETFSNDNGTNCNAVYNLCKSPFCNPTYFFIINSTNGSVYANLIPSIGSLVEPGNIAKGKIFDKGAQFDFETLENIRIFNEGINDDQLNSPTLVLNIGDQESRTTYFSKFISSTNPAYAYIRPYWLRSLSATLLSVTKKEINLDLLPGFCPFIGHYTIQQYYEVQTLIKTLVSGYSTITTFIKDQTDKRPGVNPVPSSGIRELSKSRNPIHDHWFSVVKLDNGVLALEDNDISSNASAFGAVIISLIICVYGAFIVMELIILGLNALFFKVRDQLLHLEYYKNLQVGKFQNKIPKISKEKKPKAIVLKYTLLNLLKHSPSISTYVDMLIHKILRSYADSAHIFYNTILQKQTENDDFEYIDPKKDMVTGQELKLLYEKFCFVNNFNEQKLTDPLYSKDLKKKGFAIIEDSSTLTPVFLKMTLKNFDDYTMKPTNPEGDSNTENYQDLDSLDIYFKRNVQITAFEDDQIEVETLMRLYNSFCDYNRLPKVTITPSLIAERYDVSYKEIPTQIICRIDVEQIERKCCRRKKDKKPTKYVIDKTLAEDNILMKLGRIEDIPDDRIQKVLEHDITFRFWWIADILIILAHMIVNVIISIIIIFLVILVETSYSPYSLKDPDVLLTPADIQHDPSLILYKLLNGYGWSTFVVVVAIISWILNFINLFVYYIYFEIPLTKAFHPQNIQSEKFPLRMARQVQWILVLAQISILMGYVCLAGVWCILGAILNPGLFLPFATGALTLITFIKMKYERLKDLGKRGKDMVLDYLIFLAAARMNKVLLILSNRIEGATRFIADKSKEVLKGPEFTDITNKVVTLGILSSQEIDLRTSRIINMENQIIMNHENSSPDLMVDEIDKIKEELKTKTIEKLKGECQAKNIPEDFILLMDKIVERNSLKAKEIAERLLVLKCQEESIDENIMKVILELALPSTVAKESFPQFTITVLIEKILSNTGLKFSHSELNIKEMVKLFEIATEIQGWNLSRYYNSMNSILKSELFQSKLHSHEDFKPFFVILKYIAYKQSQGHFIKPLLDLTMDNWEGIYKINSEKKFENIGFNSNFEDQQDTFSITKGDNFPLFIESCLKLIPHFAQSSDPTTHDKLGHEEQLYDMISSFIKHMPLDNYAGNEDLRKARLAVYTVLALSKQTAHELPQNYLDDFKSFIGQDDNNPELFMKIANLKYNRKKVFDQGFDELAKKYDVHPEIAAFLKLIYSYTDHVSGSLPKKRNFICKNKIFILTCKKMKLKAMELLALLDFLNQQYESKIMKYFYYFLMDKLRIRKDNFVDIKAVIDLLACDTNENMVLAAIKKLGIKDLELLLVSKKFLDPKYVPEELFLKIGISKDSVDKRKEIFTRPHHRFVDWKKNCEEEIGQNKMNLPEEDVHWYQFLFSDWPTISYSSGRIAQILVLLGKFKKFDFTRISYETGDGSGNNLIEFFRRILLLREISIQKFSEKIANLNKSEKLIKKITEEFGFEYEPLQKLLGLLLTQEFNPLDFLSYIIPEEQYAEFRITAHDENNIYRTLMLYTKNVQESRYALMDFSIDLSRRIKVKESRIPVILIQKFMIDKKFPVSLNSFLEFCEFTNHIIKESAPEEDFSARKNTKEGFLDTIALEKTKLLAKGSIDPKITEILEEEDGERSHLIEILKLRLVGSGYLDFKALPGQFRISSRFAINILNILSTPVSEDRLLQITSLFDNNDEFHSAFCLLMFLKKGNNKVTVKTKLRKAERILVDHLASVFNVYPEAFSLLSYLHVSSIDEFLEIGIPILRRLTGDSLIDGRLVKNLFTVLLGSELDPNFLANMLNCNEGHISFLNTVARLASDDFRIALSEAEKLDKAIHFNKVLRSLDIDHEEFSSLMKLFFGSLTDGIDTLLTKLHVDDEVDKTQALFKLCANQDRYLTYDLILSDLESKTAFIQTSPLFAKFPHKKSFLTAVFRMAAGNFLTIRACPELFEWAFPPGDNESEMIRNVTMSLLGLLNPKIMYQACSVVDTGFSESILSSNKKKIKGKENSDDMESYVEKETAPDNTVRYALGLLTKLLDLNPKWACYFFLDIFSFKKLDKKIGEAELVLLIVSYFSTLQPTKYNEISALAAQIRYLKSLKNLSSEEKLRLSSLQEELDKQIEIDESKFEICERFLNQARKMKVGYWQNIIQNDKVEISLASSINKFSKPDKIRLEKETEPLVNITEETEIIGPKRSWTLILKKLFKTSKTTKNYENEVETCLILGQIIQLRYEEDKVKLAYGLNCLLKMIERLLFMDGSFYKFSRPQVLKILSLFKPFLLYNELEIAHGQELYDEDYRMKMFKYKIVQRAGKDLFNMEILNSLKQEILDEGIKKLEEKFNYEEELKNIKEIMIKSKGTDLDVLLRLDIENIDLETLTDDLLSLAHRKDKKMIQKHVFDELCLTQMVNLVSLQGLNSDGANAFSDAYLKAHELFKIAYSPTRFRKITENISEALFKLHLQFTGEPSLFRGQFKSLLEPIKKATVSHDSRLEELLWAILNKQGLDDFVIKLIFTPVTARVESTIKGKDVEYGKILKDLGHKFGIDDHFIENLELLIYVFILRNEKDLPNLLVKLFKEANEADSRKYFESFMALISRLDISVFNSYKVLDSTNKSPMIADSLPEKETQAMILKDIIPMLPRSEKLVEPELFNICKHLFSCNQKKLIISMIKDNGAQFLDFVKIVCPSELKNFQACFDHFRDLIIISFKSLEDIGIVPNQQEDASPNKKGKKKDKKEVSKINYDIRSSRALKAYSQGNLDFENILIDFMTPDLGNLLNSFSKFPEVSEILVNLVSLLRPKALKKSIKRPNTLDIVSFFRKNMTRDRNTRFNRNRKVVEEKKKITPEAPPREETKEENPKNDAISLYSENKYKEMKEDIILHEKTKLKDDKDPVQKFADLLNAKFGSLFLSSIENDKIKHITGIILQLIIELEYQHTPKNYDKQRVDSLVNQMFNFFISNIKDEKNKKICRYYGCVMDLIIYILLCHKIEESKLRKCLLAFLKEFIHEYSSEETYRVLESIGSLLSMVNFAKIDPNKVNSIPTDPQRAEDLVKHILESFIPTLLPDLVKIITGDKVLILFNILCSFKGSYKDTVEDKKKRRNISSSLLEDIKRLNIMTEKAQRALKDLYECFQLLEAEEWDEFMDLYIELSAMTEGAKANALKIYQECKTLLDFTKITASIYKIKGSSKTLTQDPDKWASIISKIKEGKASNKELFKIMSDANEGRGITQIQFKILANRLGVTLSDQRVAETFAKVKESSSGRQVEELDENQFDKALEYLQQKNLDQTLILMRITPEMLTAIWLRLIILLILILIFVFFGITAFALGGAFGSIVNSTFPVLAGVGLGKKTDDEKEILSKENIEEKTDKALTIVQSDII